MSRTQLSDAPHRLFRLLLALALAVSLLLALFLALAAVTRPAHADTLCVKPNGGDGCQASITAALALAQENDTIRVAVGVYNENVLISQTVTLQGGWSPDFDERDVSAYLSVILPADNTQSVVSIQGDFADTSLVAPTLEGFVITGGRADLGSNHGGGLRIVDSDAFLISNTIQNNVAFLLGGGVWVQRGAPLLEGNQIRDNLSVGLGQDAHGGGVHLENSPATLLDNVFAGNVVSGTEAFGGGLEIAGTGAAQAVIRRNQFISNTALITLDAEPDDFGYGGAIAVSSGQILLEESRLISNTAGIGGGIFLGGNFEDCCNMTTGNNLLRANTALRGGGMAMEGDGEDCCEFTSEGDAYYRNSADLGGGLYNTGHVARIRGGEFISNTAAVDGGALLIGNGGFISVTETLAMANQAGQNGGGVLIGAGAFISITNSAAVANQAVGDGGGIYNAGFISVTNSTVSGNDAGGMGGGIANFNTVDLVNATVSDNASAGGAGFFNANLVSAVNSLIALNVGDNCMGAAMNSLGHNLEDGGTCALGHSTDITNTAPSMGALADNGGSTPSHALAADSPAVDAGDNAACDAFDQRGVPRPLDGDGDGNAVCDIGAFERQQASTTSILADDPDPSAPGEPFTVTVSVTGTVGEPSGAMTVTASDGAGSCTGTLASGLASCSLTIATPGTYTLTATYDGDDAFAASSATAIHTVQMPEIEVNLYLPAVLRE